MEFGVSRCCWSADLWPRVGGKSHFHDFKHEILGLNQHQVNQNLKKKKLSSQTHKSFLLHLLRSPTLIYEAFHRASRRRGALPGPRRAALTAVRPAGQCSAGTPGGADAPLAQPLFINPFHTGRSHYARSCQWASLSVLCIYLIISRSGGADKSADCLHCGAFSAGGET